MVYWYWFWTGCFVVSGGAFVIIALIVWVRGVQDLRTMFRKLREDRDDQVSATTE